MEAVVRAVDDVGVVERADRLERAHDALDHVVDRLQRREAPLFVLEPADVHLIERRHAADEVGFVADVRLVESGRARQRRCANMSTCRGAATDGLCGVYGST